MMDRDDPYASRHRPRAYKQFRQATVQHGERVTRHSVSRTVTGDTRGDGATPTSPYSSAHVGRKK